MPLLVIAAGALFPVAAQAACDDHAPYFSALPPPVMPAALARRYPNGYGLRFSLGVDAAGRPGSIGDLDVGYDPVFAAPKVEAADLVALRPALEAILAHGRVIAAQKNCKSVPGKIVYDNFELYSPASGILGIPNVAGGVDFDFLHYTNGPGSCTNATLQGGHADFPAEEYDESLEAVFAGKAGGSMLAIALLRCEYNGHGYDDVAQLFRIANGRAQRLRTIAAFGQTGPDSPGPPGNGIYVNFTGSSLIIDTWDQTHACDPTRDWTSTTYTLRSGNLTTLNTTHHHRPGLTPSCDR